MRPDQHWARYELGLESSPAELPARIADAFIDQLEECLRFLAMRDQRRPGEGPQCIARDVRRGRIRTSAARVAGDDQQAGITEPFRGRRGRRASVKAKGKG
jgi:hypothetical protein